MVADRAFRFIDFGLRAMFQFVRVRSELLARRHFVSQHVALYLFGIRLRAVLVFVYGIGYVAGCVIQMFAHECGLPTAGMV